AVLRDGDVLALRLPRDLLPDLPRAGDAAALDGVDEDALLHRELAGVGVLHVVRVVHVGGRVAHQVDDPQRARVGRPGNLPDGVDVRRQGGEPGDVLVAPVAVGNEAELDVRQRLAAHDLVRDGPDLPLRALDEARHTARRIEREDDLDLRLRLRRRLVRAGDG